MLHEFLTERRSELIDRCRAKVSLRSSPKATVKELDHGIPMFLDQLTKTLRVEQTSEPMRSRKVSGPAGGGEAVLSEISESAARHGGELLRDGYTVEQVVHDYGDLCQAITDLAFEVGEVIETDEFRTLNRCLDNGIAVAVTEYNYQRDSLIADRQFDAVNERFGAFAHELRNLLNTSILALTAIKAGNVGLTGATGAVLDRSLVGLRNLIDRSLSDVRASVGIPHQHHLFSLADFISEVRLSANLEAETKGCTLVVSEVDPLLAVDADRDLLLAAVSNLLQNAFKFTRPHTEVTLNAYAVADRILIDVEDKCGGLPPNFAEKMFLPFTQAAEDQSGLGLGLSISRRNVEANEGTLSARDVPGVGCIFTINLPRFSTDDFTERPEAPPVESDPFQMVTSTAAARKLCVLIAEDSAINRKLLERVFECLSLAPPVMVKDGKLAVALAATGMFDVILLDSHMPIMDGCEAARRIRASEKMSASPKRVFIIAITGAAEADDRTAALDAGMDEFLTKPLDIPLLAQVFERIAATR